MSNSFAFFTYLSHFERNNVTLPVQVARAAVQRRQNLQTSVDDLQHQLTSAEAALDLADTELARDERRVDLDNVVADRRVGCPRSTY